MWPFSKTVKPDETLLRIDARLDGVIKSEQQAWATVEAKSKELATANAKISELQSKVREQTEADLYLTSAKIMRDILEKVKTTPADAQKQGLLQQQLAALQQSGNTNPYSYALGNLVGAQGAFR